MKGKKNKSKAGKYNVVGTTDDARRKDSPYYLVRLGKPTKPRKYKTGDEIWEVAKRYFAAVDDSPMKETKVFGSGYTKEMDLQIPYTLTGFYVFAGMDDKMMDRYCKLDQKDWAEDEEKYLAQMCRHIKKVIYTQKIEGASTGKFNHMIVALELGLAAKVKTEVVKHDSSKMTAEEIKRFNNELEEEY